ncbi:DUF2892 domain-containing protein [Myxococcaceae bacterium GXIMD 01537]
MVLVGFVVSRAGRWARILAGAGMVVGGLASGTPKGAAVAFVGLAPLLTGVFDLFPLGPLLGLPVRGAEVRQRLGMEEEERLPSTMLH